MFNRKNFDQKQREDTKNPLNQSLISASAKLNLTQIIALIQQGADPNYIKYSGGDAWYQGNTTTPLYAAINAKFQNEENYIMVIKYLLGKGADPNFQSRRGGWNHYAFHPIFSHHSNILNKFSKDQLKYQFIEMFVKHGINLNVEQHDGKDKDFKSWETHNCFIFDILDEYGMSSRLYKLVGVDAGWTVEKMKKKKRDEDKRKFFQTYKDKFDDNTKLDEQEEEKEQQNSNQSEKQENFKKLDPQKLNFIIKILKLGINANSSRSQKRWQNFNIHNYSQKDMDLEKYQSYKNQYFQSLLHRAIFYNVPEMVKFLLEKGSRTTVKLIYTTSKLIYPNQWPKKLKEFKANSNRQQLKDYQNERQKLLKKIQNITDPTQKKQIQRQIKDYDFLIYQCQQFTIQNQCPVTLYEVKQLSCIELAKILKVDQSIIDMLQNYSQKQFKQPPPFLDMWDRKIIELPKSKSKAKTQKNVRDNSHKAGKKINLIKQKPLISPSWVTLKPVPNAIILQKQAKNEKQGRLKKRK